MADGLRERAEWTAERDRAVAAIVGHAHGIGRLAVAVAVEDAMVSASLLTAATMLRMHGDVGEAWSDRRRVNLGPPRGAADRRRRAP